MSKMRVGVAMLLSVALLAGCQSTKKTTATKQPKPAKVVRVKTPKKTGKKSIKTADTAVVLTPATGTDLIPTSPAYAPLSQRLDVLSGSNLAFQTFSGKAKAKLTRSDESNEFTANIRIRHDQAIWINISALGGMVNVARVYITPDSVRMINFLQKTATLLPFADAGKLLPVAVSFGDLQALLLGYAPKPSQVPEHQVAAIRQLGDTMKRQVSGGGFSQTDFFTLPDSTFRGYELANGGPQQPFTLVMLLSNRIQENGRVFYKERAAHWVAPVANGELQLEFDNPQWDGEVAMPFTVPKSYDLN